MLKLFVLINFCFIQCMLSSTAAESAADRTCARNEIYYNSSQSPTCDVNCQDLNRICRLTHIRPVAGCYCRLGYARNLRQQCIPVNDCEKDCFPNEVPINPRQRECEKTCRTVRAPALEQICYTTKQRRCICASQHCRNRRGQCVGDMW